MAATGRFVQKCPKCGARDPVAVAFQCLKCQGTFIFPRRKMFKRQSDALKACGVVNVGHSGKIKKFFVDVCPLCDEILFVGHNFKCPCGGSFDRWDAVLVWDGSEENGSRKSL